MGFYWSFIKIYSLFIKTIPLAIQIWPFFSWPEVTTACRVWICRLVVFAGLINFCSFLTLSCSVVSVPYILTLPLSICTPFPGDLWSSTRERLGLKKIGLWASLLELFKYALMIFMIASS
jgi:hypothetical protein